MGQRVLFTASTASHIRNFHLPYLRRFHELGWTVDVACGAPVEDIPGADRVIPLPFRKKLAAPANFRAAAVLRREMKRTPYDLVITHTSLAAFFTRLALPRGAERPKVVNMVHGYLFQERSPGLKGRLLLWAEKLTASRTDLVLTMNWTDYDLALRHKLGQAVENVPGVGVDFPRLDESLARAEIDLHSDRALSARLAGRLGGNVAREKATLRKILNIPQDAFVFLYAAEFSKRKNQALLLRALAQLPQRSVLALPGQGALEAECQALAKALGLGDRVLFPGHVADMGPWYALADAAVSASYSEGLPFNIMEAMYAALPIAATAVKGHTDLLEGAKAGLLFPPDDPKLCARAMGKLMDDPQLCRRLGKAAHQAALPYGLDQVLPQVMEWYLSLTPTPVAI